MPLSNIYLVEQTHNAVFAAQLRSHLLFVSIDVEKSANAKHVAAAKALLFRTSHVEVYRCYEVAYLFQ